MEKMERFVNWAELSRYLSGASMTVRKNRIPLIHKQLVKRVLAAMRRELERK